MNTLANAIQDFFAKGDQSLSAYLAALSAIGLATMAIIQSIKDATPVRMWFQRMKLHQWLEQGITEARRPRRRHRDSDDSVNRCGSRSSAACPVECGRR